MPSVDALLDAYRAAHRAGDPDPAPFLAQVAGDERRELEALIAAFRARQPAPAFATDPLTQRIQAATADRMAETWPALLPERRAQVEIPRSRLVRRLAEALGVADRAEKVGGYYHRMETGTLPADGVDHRVLEALGRLLGVSAERLRAAGERTLPPAGGAVFARSAEPLPPTGAASLPIGSTPEEEDEVDRLFTGG